MPPYFYAHFFSVDPSVIIYWISPPINSGASGLVDVYQFIFILRSNVFLFYANSIDVGQMARFAASDLGLHYLTMTLLWDTRQKCVKCHCFKDTFITRIKKRKKANLFCKC